MHRLFGLTLLTLVGLVISEEDDRLVRTPLSSGILMKNKGPVEVVDEIWTIVVVTHQPLSPPADRLKREALRLLQKYGDAFEPSELSSLKRRVAAWRVHAPALRTTMITSDGNATRKRRGLINVAGEALNFLFGVATEEEVTVLQEAVKTARENDQILYHNQERMISVLNETQKYVARNRQATSLLFKVYRQLEKKRLAEGEVINKLKIARRVRIYLNNVERALDMASGALKEYDALASSLASGQLTRHVISESSLRLVLAKLNGRGPSLEWIYLHTPVLTLSVTRNVITASFEIWVSGPKGYEFWALHSFPYKLGAFMSRATTRDAVVVDVKRERLFYPTNCRGSKPMMCLAGSFHKVACELGLIAGRKHSCRLEISRSVSMQVVGYDVNQYVIIPPQIGPTVLMIVCDKEQVRTVTVRNTELWWVHPACDITSVNFTTHGVRSFRVEVWSEWVPPVIVNVTFEIEAKVAEQIPLELDFHELLHINSKGGPILDPLIKNDFEISHNPYRAAMYAFLVGVSLLVIVISLYCSRNMWRRKCARKRRAPSADPESVPTAPKRRYIKPPKSDFAMAEMAAEL